MFCWVSFSVSYSYCILFVYLVALTPVCVYVVTCSQRLLSYLQWDSKLHKGGRHGRLAAQPLHSTYHGAGTQ